MCPVSLLKPTVGIDGVGCVSLTEESYKKWDQLMIEENIVQGSRKDPLWKIKLEQKKVPKAQKKPAARWPKRRTTTNSN